MIKSPLCAEPENTLHEPRDTLHARLYGFDDYDDPITDETNGDFKKNGNRS